MKKEKIILLAMVGTIKDNLMREKANQLLYLNGYKLSQELVDLLIAAKPKLIQFIPVEFQTEELCMKIIDTKPKLFKHIKNRTEKICLYAVKKKASNFKFIENPSKKVQLEAVKGCGDNIRFIEEPDKDVCLQAVKSSPRVVAYIDFDEDICMEAIKLDPYVIRTIEFTFDMVKKAYELNPYSILYLESDDERIIDLKLEAYRKAIRNKNDKIIIPFVFNRIKDKLSENEILSSIKINHTLIIDIDSSEITFEMKKAIIKSSKPSKIIDFIDEFSTSKPKKCNSRYYLTDDNEYRELWKIALMKDGLLIKHLYHPDDELCKIAIRQNNDAYIYISKPSEEVTKFALNLNGKLLEYVSCDKQTVELCEMAIKSNLKAAMYVDMEGEELINLIDKLGNEDTMYLNYLPLDVIKKIQDN